METKGKVRSFADIFGEDAVPDPKQQAGVTEIEISKLVPFANHPFKLYEGERFNDLHFILIVPGIYFNENCIFYFLSSIVFREDF
jgi:hypothetical protein